MTFPLYPLYKQSGNDWLGDIPSQWGVKRLKYLFNLMKRAITDEDEIVTCFRDGQVTLRRNRREDGFTNALKEIGYQGVRSGDLVIHAMDAFAGAVGVSDSDGKCSPVYSICEPRDSGVSSNYYGLLLRHMALAGFITSLAKGIRERSTDFRWSDASEIFFPVPSAAEQKHIIRFLDHEVGKIDALIAEQEKLITLLKEKRQAVISHAVTKGLNPDAPMKDSGAEWLGQVPKHWDVARMRFLCSITTGSRDTQDAREEGDYPFFVRSDTIERIDTYSFDGEGVFTSGDGAGVGKIFHHFTGKCEIHQRVYLFHKFKRISGSFFYNYLRTNLEPVVLSQSAKSTVDSLRMPMLQNFWMTCPPEDEQEDICNFINKVELETADLLNESEKAVSLLKERRSALISAAVTGKIDVRDWQPPAENINPANKEVCVD